MYINRSKNEARTHHNKIKFTNSKFINNRYYNNNKFNF